MLTLLLLAATITKADSTDISWQSGYPEQRLHNTRWEVSTGKKQCRMTLSGFTGEQLFLQSRERDELQLVLDIPYRQNTLAESRLSWLHAPWHQQASPTRLGAGTISHNGRTVFSDNIRQLTGRLSQGYWGQITLNTRDGEELVFRISSIDFREPFKKFNACRNQLPPVRLERIRNTSVYFASGSADLTGSYKGLDLIVQYLAYAPETVTGITIDGYADSAGPSLRNLDLSRYRARAVADYLVAAGVDKKRIQAVRHHGERYPAAGNPKKSHNRRVDIRLHTGNKKDQTDIGADNHGASSGNEKTL